MKEKIWRTGRSWLGRLKNAYLFWKIRRLLWTCNVRYMPKRHTTRVAPCRKKRKKPFNSSSFARPVCFTACLKMITPSQPVLTWCSNVVSWDRHTIFNATFIQRHRAFRVLTFHFKKISATADPLVALTNVAGSQAYQSSCFRKGRVHMCLKRVKHLKCEMPFCFANKRLWTYIIQSQHNTVIQQDRVVVFHCPYRSWHDFDMFQEFRWEA